MSRGSFERDTTHRLFNEAVRHWLISHYLESGEVEEVGVYYCYPNGPVSLDWGADLLAGKRIRVTMELQDMA